MTAHATLPEDLEAELNAELDAIAGAEGAEGVSDDYLRFAGRVARAQAKARAAIRAVAGSDRHRFDNAVLMDLLRDIVDSSDGEGREAYLQSIVAAAEADASLLRRLVAAITPGGDARPLQQVADQHGLPAHALILIARLLAAPFLVEARQRDSDLPELDARGMDAANGGENASEARVGRCPTCASGAGLAVLRAGDGARRLICLLCGEAWLAPRLMCAFCGTRDQSKLGTLHVAEGDPRWVEVCDACRRYLKTVDQRLLPDGYAVVPRAEDARTLHLDMIAEREGYIRPAL